MYHAIKRRLISRSTLLIAAAACTAACENQDAEPIPQTEAPIITQGTPRGGIVAALNEPHAEHCIQDEINAIADPFERFEEAFECGDELFETVFNSLDGVGAHVGDGARFTRVPRADLAGPGQWASHTPERATGPNADACNGCHNTIEKGSGSGAEFGDGSGGPQMNVHRDPQHTAFVGQFIQRNTPHLFAIGAIQRLAEEMTEELHALRAAANEDACRRRGSNRVRLVAKGVDFGTLSVRCRGREDTRGVRGIDPDLIVRPLQWKGSVAFVRDFNRGASHNELGMQAVEITGDGVDGDGDGVVNEFGIGDQTALAVYTAGQPRPSSLAELSALGLLEHFGLVDDEGNPVPVDTAAISRGEAIFNSVGCADCHKPSLVIDVPVFSEPSQNPNYRDSLFPAGQDPIARGVDPANSVSFNLTTDQPDNIAIVGGMEVRLGSFDANADGGAIVRLYGDLKRHNMGSGLAENIDEVGTGAATFLTENLWGVGSTAPYLHDGRATTITEAILEHGGEGTTSRVAFQRLSGAQQADLLAFLENLVLVKQ